MRLVKATAYVMFIKENYRNIFQKINNSLPDTASSVRLSPLHKTKWHQQCMRRTHEELGKLWQQMPTSLKDEYRRRAAEHSVMEAERVARMLSEHSSRYGSPFAEFVKENFQSTAAANTPLVHPSEILRQLAVKWRENRDVLMPEYSIRANCQPVGSEFDQARIIQEKPKRPTNAFIIFRSEVAKELLQQTTGEESFPGCSFVSGQRKMALISASAAKRWAEMTPEQKQTYIDHWKAQSQQYILDKSKYEARRPVEDLLKNARSVNRRSLRRLGLLKNSKAPPTAFHFYQKEMFSQLRKNTNGRTLAELNRLVGEQWRKMDRVQKQKYFEQSWQAAENIRSKGY